MRSMQWTDTGIFFSGWIGRTDFPISCFAVASPNVDISLSEAGNNR